MQFDSLIPRDPTTLLYVVVASILAWLGGWFTRRNREPIELDKVKAETKSIHITAENSQVSTGLETLREIQTVIQKAEQRREEWNQREEELRTQIRFWRNKAEELDGELADSREVNGLLKSEMANYENQIRTMQATLTIKHKNYDNSQDMKPADYTLPPKE